MEKRRREYQDSRVGWNARINLSLLKTADDIMREVVEENERRRNTLDISEQR
jgi:hypothetical protein